MHVCIPVDEDRGLESRVCQHFGTASLFMIVDTETGVCRAVRNQNADHAHGTCEPLLMLRGEALDGIIVAGIGRGALERLELDRVRVFRTEHGSVGETIAALRSGALRQLTTGEACTGHLAP
jgi:predicted Fe-Mo cluster-binding NifX family protein